MRLHLLGLAHTVTNRDYMPCAYTQKVLKMAHMMTRLGYEVIHYGAEGSAVPCEHVTVVTRADQETAYGRYDWRREFFRHDPNDHAYQTFTKNAIREINARKDHEDILLVSFGTYQAPIANAVGLQAVEMGIGYTGCFAKYRVFESYAWMHWLYGKSSEAARFYDVVIPNYFDLRDFTLQRKKDDYFCYVGRLIESKGVQIAIDVARELDARLLIAGQGTLERFRCDGAKVEHLGTVNAAERDELLGHARAVFVPTLYIEPFGGVAVEAQLCGTPVLTTDWGAFPETVLHGVTGYRCRTFDDFIWGAQHAGDLDPIAIREWAARNFSMERIGPMYAEFLSKVHDLWRGGWYERHPERTELDWLRRYYV